MGPLWREMLLSRAFCYTTLRAPPKKSLLIQKNINFLSKSLIKEPPPSMFPNMAPMERAAPFPKPVVYSSIYICQSPQLRSSPTKWGKNIQSPSMEPHEDRRTTHNGVWSGSLRGSFTTLLLLPQCHAVFSTIPSILACVDQSPVSQCVS